MKINAITFSLLLTSMPTLAQIPVTSVDVNTPRVENNKALQPIEQITVTATRSKNSLNTLDSNLSVVTADDIAFINQQHINQAIAVSYTHLTLPTNREV